MFHVTLPPQPEELTVANFPGQIALAGAFKVKLLLELLPTVIELELNSPQ